jgi:hypothetical protein
MSLATIRDSILSPSAVNDIGRNENGAARSDAVVSNRML